MIFFKHCHYANPQEWGVHGLPDNNTSHKAFGNYKPNSLVLLAQDSRAKGEYMRTVFRAGCGGATRELSRGKTLRDNQNMVFRVSGSVAVNPVTKLQSNVGILSVH